MTVHEITTRLQRAWPGWEIWFGTYSQCWWAMPRGWQGPNPPRVLRGYTPDDLARQMGCHGPAAGPPLAAPVYTAAALGGRG